MRIGEEERKQKQREASKRSYAKNKHKYPKRDRREYGKAHAREQRQIVSLYKASVGCVDCGCNDSRVLDFDHVYGKEFNIASKITGSLEKVFTEIQKCEVRCSNCHRIKTWSKHNGE